MSELDRRSFLLSAAAGSLATLAARAAIEAPGQSQLLLGESAVNIFAQLQQSADRIIGDAQPWVRISIYDPMRIRWNVVNEIPAPASGNGLFSHVSMGYLWNGGKPSTFLVNAHIKDATMNERIHRTSVELAP